MHKQYAYIKVTADNEVSLIETDHFIPELEEIHKIIECDYINLVKTFDDDIIMCIDDNGKISKKKENFVATSLYKYSMYDSIAGTVLFGVLQDEYKTCEPDFYPFTYETAEKLYTHISEYAERGKNIIEDSKDED